MGKMRLGHDPRQKSVPLLRTTKVTQDTLAALSKEDVTAMLDAHKEELQKLTDSHKPQEYQSMKVQEPTVIVEKQIHTVETIKTIDKRARTHSVAVRNELHNIIVKKHALLNKAYELQKNRADELASKIHALEARKPQELHTVTKEVVIQEKTSKRMLIICAATIIINVLILISK